MFLRKHYRMKRILYILLLLFFAGSLYSEIPPFRVVPDVVYGHKAGMALTFDVLIPDSANGAGVIHIISAGWRSEYQPVDSVKQYYAPLLEKGYTVFRLRHGSSPYFKIPAMVNDVEEGVKNIREHAHDYGVDPDHLGIYGGSAGGQLALMVGTMNDTCPVAAVVAFYAPADLREVPTFAKKMYPALDLDSADLAYVSAITYVTPNDAPTLLMHGDFDFVVPLKLSQMMYDTLVENGVPARFVIINGMMHGGMFGGKGKHFERTTEEMLKWFDKYLLPQPSAASLSEKIIPKANLK